MTFRDWVSFSPNDNVLLEVVTSKVLVGKKWLYFHKDVVRHSSYLPRVVAVTLDLQIIYVHVLLGVARVRFSYQKTHKAAAKTSLAFTNRLRATGLREGSG